MKNKIYVQENKSKLTLYLGVSYGALENWKQKHEEEFQTVLRWWKEECLEENRNNKARSLIFDVEILKNSKANNKIYEIVLKQKIWEAIR